MDAAARMTSKGQITAPKVVRDGLGIAAGDEVVSDSRASAWLPSLTEEGRGLVKAASEYNDLYELLHPVDPLDVRRQQLRFYLDERLWAGRSAARHSRSPRSQ